MSMALLSLVTDLQASLHDAGSMFERADFERHIAHAAADFHRVRPRIIAGSLTLTAEQGEYDCPSDLLTPWICSWGQSSLWRPWELASATQMKPEMVVSGDGANRKLELIPAPTTAQIADFGATMKYFYRAAHTVAESAANTTVRVDDRGLLLLRAQVEAMKELAMRNMTKPVRIRDGLSQGPRNATPAALHEQLMDEYERLAA